jgi:hypothetical protein
MFSQITHDVTVQNFSFSPQSLTIIVGDIVKWTNISGTHNVRANDNSFYSGPAAPAPWEFTHTFTAAGNNPYYCEPHAGMGMTGTIIVQNPVGVEDEAVLADKFELKQNYPNPFNPSTKISWQSSVASYQTIKVYDVLGNEVATLVDEFKPAGNFEVEFDASKLTSGMYLYKLQSGSFVETRKMILLR